MIRGRIEMQAVHFLLIVSFFDNMCKSGVSLGVKVIR